MADPVEPVVIPASAAAAPALSAEPAPVIESVAPAQADQVAAASPAPVAAELPAAAGAEVSPEPVAEPTLLDKFDEKKADPDKKPDAAEAKPADKPAEEKPAEPEKVADPAAEVVAEPVAEIAAVPEVDYFAAETGIKLPETITLDDTTRGELKTALDLLRAEPVKGAQALIDLHAKQMADFAQLSIDNQWAVFRKMNEDSIAVVMADAVLGGAGHETAMAQAAIARDNLASREKPGTEKYLADLKEFNDDLRATGMGNRRSMLRFMHNAARFVREASLPPPNPKPTPDTGKNPTAKKGGLIYDAPSSQPTS